MPIHVHGVCQKHSQQHKNMCVQCGRCCPARCKSLKVSKIIHCVARSQAVGLLHTLILLSSITAEYLRHSKHSNSLYPVIDHQ